MLKVIVAIVISLSGLSFASAKNYQITCEKAFRIVLNGESPYQKRSGTNWEFRYGEYFALIGDATLFIRQHDNRIDVDQVLSARTDFEFVVMSYLLEDFRGKKTIQATDGHHYGSMMGPATLLPNLTCSVDEL